MIRSLALFLMAGAALAQTPAKGRMVVLISLDGFPAFALEDPKLPVPTLRALISKGAMAKRMTTVNPTVTWPNHTAMVTGVNASRHGVLANGSIVRTGSWPPLKVEPWADKDKMVQVPTVYDAAHRAGLTTAQVDWVAIYKAPTITWEFPEVPSSSGKVEREMIAGGMLTSSDVDALRKDNILRRDQVWTDAAAHIIRRHKPNLMLFHLLSLDSSHHSYGPRTLAGQAAMAFLDSCVARIVQAIRDAGMEDRATILIVSDHGFKPFTKTVQPSAMLSAAQLERSAHVIPEGGTAFVYLEKPADAPAIRKLFAGAEGIDQVVESTGYAALGLPDPSKNAQMPHLLLVAKNGYSFGGGTNGGAVVARPSPGGAHGHLSTDPELDAIFLASGYGIRAGVTVDRVRNIDIAPTIAELLGLRMENTDGQVLREFLK